MPQQNWKSKLHRMKNFGNYGSIYKQKNISISRNNAKKPLIKAVSRDQIQTMRVNKTSKPR